MTVSPVKLIDEVKKRPGLYCNSPPSDREERLALWKEVGAALCRDWGSYNKATEYDKVLQIQRKWRSLRDAYNRELRSRRSGVRVNKRTYIYFKKMSFLGGYDGELSEDEMLFDEEGEDTANSGSGDPLTAPTPAPASPARPRARHRRPRVRRAPSSGSPARDELEMPMFPVEMAEPDAEDSDRLFLLSFLPEMRQLPVNIKMWVRSQIANVMQEAVACHYTDTQPSPATRSYVEIKHQAVQ